MSPLREISHTADVGFEVEARRLDELFGLAATGLREALGIEAAGAGHGGGDRAFGAEDDAGEQREDPAGEVAGAEAAEEVLELSRPDLERLLVEWLRELLWRAIRTGRVPEPVAIEVRAPAQAPAGRLSEVPEEAREEGASGEREPGRKGAYLRARVRWRPAAAPPTREIKGITYHGLSVRREGGGWHARVVLDV